MSTSTVNGSERAVLVCGLGQLGQAVLVALRGYRVPVRAVELRASEGVSEALDRLTYGDFRSADTLRAGGILECRSILLLAGDPKVNMEGALTARHLHPEIRVVVRADEQSRYALLRASLGNIVAYEPHRLAAASLGLAALDSELRAHFELAHQLFQVVEHEVASDDPFRGRLLSEVETRRMRVLWRSQAGERSRAPIALRRDPPTTAIAAGTGCFS